LHKRGGARAEQGRPIRMTGQAVYLKKFAEKYGPILRRAKADASFRQAITVGPNTGRSTRLTHARSCGDVEQSAWMQYGLS
jgi:hypothetical protein